MKEKSLLWSLFELFHDELSNFILTSEATKTNGSKNQVINFELESVCKRDCQIFTFPPNIFMHSTKLLKAHLTHRSVCFGRWHVGLIFCGHSIVGPAKVAVVNWVPPSPVCSIKFNQIVLLFVELQCSLNWIQVCEFCRTQNWSFWILVLSQRPLHHFGNPVS